MKNRENCDQLQVTVQFHGKLQHQPQRSRSEFSPEGKLCVTVPGTNENFFYAIVTPPKDPSVSEVCSKL